jgi:hypothetical protein
MKRLTILPPDTAEGDPAKPRKDDGDGEGAVRVRAEERRKQPRAERRMAQRRKQIARRVNPDRRISLNPIRDAFFVDSRSGVERRMVGVRRRVTDRRHGVRKIDLTNLDLSELDN